MQSRNATSSGMTAWTICGLALLLLVANLLARDSSAQGMGGTEPLGPRARGNHTTLP